MKFVKENTWPRQMKNNNLFLILFAFDACMELFFPFWFPEHVYIRFVTKPLLMTFLFLYVQSHIDLSNKSNILFALFFAWLGDVFLLIPGDNALFFQLGLGAFLIMQIAYIRLFFKQTSYLTFVSLKYLALTILPVVLYVVLFLNFLIPYLVEELILPIILYALALGSMMYFSLQRFRSASFNNFCLVLMGALLFVISDSLLALAKFYYSFPGNSFFVMLTYILSQFFLIKGLVAFVPLQKNKF